MTVVSVLAAYIPNGDLQMLLYIVYILVPTLLYINHCLGSPVIELSIFSQNNFKDISDMKKSFVIG